LEKDKEGAEGKDQWHMEKNSRGRKEKRWLGKKCVRKMVEERKQ
jgi:hypothetical protein